jgi:hypothetical protein
MICVLPHHPPPSPISKLDKRPIGRLKKRDNLLTGERGGVREESFKSYESEKAPLVLYESFNALCEHIFPNVLKIL